jgi:cyclase
MLLNRRQYVSNGMLATAATAMPVWAMQPGAAQASGTPPTVPVDRIAQMRQAGATTPIKVTRLRDTIFLLQGAGGNMVAQIGPDGKLLIDSSFATAATRIQQALAGLDAHPLKLLVNTHWHFDHTDGNAAQHDAGAFIIAHTKTRERLSTPQELKVYNLKFSPSPNSALPQQTFDDQEKLYYNNDELSLVHFADAHTDTDIYIHFQNANVIHTGDLWFNGFYPLIDDGTGGTINGMIRASDQILGIADDNTKIVPGHGPLGDKAALAKYRDMLATVATKVEKLKAGGQSLAEVVAAKPSADYDAAWGTGNLPPDTFVTLIYNTLP